MSSDVCSLNKLKGKQSFNCPISLGVILNRSFNNMFIFYTVNLGLWEYEVWLVDRYYEYIWKYNFIYITIQIYHTLNINKYFFSVLSLALFIFILIYSKWVIMGMDLPEYTNMKHFHTHCSISHTEIQKQV